LATQNEKKKDDLGPFPYPFYLIALIFHLSTDMFSLTTLVFHHKIKKLKEFYLLGRKVQKNIEKTTDTLNKDDERLLLLMH